MKKALAVLMMILILLSICSCKTEKAEEKRYEPIYGYTPKETTHVVKAKFVEGDCYTYHNLKFELEKSFWGEGIGEEFVTFIPVLNDYGNVHYEVDYLNEWFRKTSRPQFIEEETYILCLKWKPYESSGNSNSGRYQIMSACLCK